MQKAFLMSILAATVLIPILCARGGTVKQAARRSAIATGVFCVLYWLGLLFLYPMLAPPKANIGVTNPGQGATPGE